MNICIFLKNFTIGYENTEIISNFIKDIQTDLQIYSAKFNFKSTKFNLPTYI